MTPDPKQDGQQAQETSPLARLPDHNTLDEWLGVHMARAAKEYDEALRELGRLNERAHGRYQQYMAEIDKLRPLVDDCLAGKRELDGRVARAWLRICELERKALSEDHAKNATAAGTHAPDDPNRPLPGRELGTNPEEWAKRREQPLERWPGLDEEEYDPAKHATKPAKLDIHRPKPRAATPDKTADKTRVKLPVLRPDADIRNADWMAVMRRAGKYKEA